MICKVNIYFKNHMSLIYIQYSRRPLWGRITITPGETRGRAASKTNNPELVEGLNKRCSSFLCLTKEKKQEKVNRYPPLAKNPFRSVKYLSGFTTLNPDIF